MSDPLEDDENMIVLVVGDEAKAKGGSLQVPFPITVKIEPLDGTPKGENDIFKSSQTEDHSEDKESIKEEFEVEYLDEDVIKTENVEEPEDYEVEYLEDLDIESEEHEDSEYEVDDNENDDDDDSDDDDYSDHENEKPRKRSSRINARGRKKQKNKTGQKKLKRRNHNAVSFVKQLRKTYPEFAEDEQLLVEHLAQIMRETKPPPPPENFCQEVHSAEEIVLECSFCDAVSTTLPFAARHYQFKHGEFYLTCFACGVTYRNTTNLYKHEKRCTAPDARIVLRARGLYLGRKGRGRPFTTTTPFITCNTPVHKTVKGRISCSKCPASFVHQENLIAHENSHTGQRPYRCHLCSMAYTSRTALRRHLRLHGDSQYVCDHCGREFKLKPALVSHLDTHRTLRKYPCTYCERRFAQKTALRHHMNKIHLNLPPAHGCPVCPKRYARVTHVKEHMHRAHGLTMITRRMYFQALPAMTEAEVKQARKLFNFDMSHTTDTKTHNIDKKDNNDLQKFVQIIKKNDQEPKEIQNKEYYNIKTNNIPTKEDPETMETDEPDFLPKEDLETMETDVPDFLPKVRIRPDVPKPRKRKRVIKRHIIKAEESEVDEIEDSLVLCDVKSKRNKKTASPSLNQKIANDDMYQVERNIKSTLPRKKVVQTKEKTQNFYELKREFMNNLKNELDKPEDAVDSEDERWEIVVQETDSVENETEVAANVTLNKKGRSSLNIERGDDTSDEEEWKVYKDVSEKNMVIADFLDYMKSGVVPKHVPILRRGRKKEVFKKLVENETNTGV